MPSKEVVRCFECPEDIGGRIRSELQLLFQVDVVGLLNPYSRLLLCTALFTEAYLISDELLNTIKKLWSAGRNPYSAGIYLGRLRKRKPYLIPSTILASAVFSRLGRYVNSVVVSDSGLKPFLYGRDVLKTSVIKAYPTIVKGSPTFVLGIDGYVYGVGIATTNGEDIGRLDESEVVVKNVFDVGWYLRGGTQPKEKKFKV
ncbi:MAG: hypothetical protein QXY36_01420 [Sulfolobales archaeon]